MRWNKEIENLKAVHDVLPLFWAWAPLEVVMELTAPLALVVTWINAGLQVVLAREGVSGPG